MRARGKIIRTQALIDSGAGGVFINPQFARKEGLPISPLVNTIRTYNVDGTHNVQGDIKEETFCCIEMNGVSIMQRFFHIGMANETIIIGLPWLKQFNPQIDWVKSTINIPREKLLEVQRKSAFELASRIKEAGIRRRFAKRHIKR